MSVSVSKRVGKTPQKIALLDFDGVVLRNANIHRAVRARVDQYVGRAIKTECGDVARHMNSYLYNTYGHTLLGLEKVVGKDASGSLRDFNDFVYSEASIDRGDFYEAKKEMVDWKRFLAKLKFHDIPVYMFSNAPREWCANFIDPSEVSGFVGDSLPYDSEFLKPEVRVFEVVDSWFKFDQVYFIDDRVHNMKWSIKNDNWINIVFDENQPRDSFKLQDRLYVSKSLDACVDIIV